MRPNVGIIIEKYYHSLVSNWTYFDSKSPTLDATACTSSRIQNDETFNFNFCNAASQHFSGLWSATVEQQRADNDFANGANWTGWTGGFTGSNQNWDINLLGADRAILSSAVGNVQQDVRIGDAGAQGGGSHCRWKHDCDARSASGSRRIGEPDKAS